MSATAHERKSIGPSGIEVKSAQGLVSALFSRYDLLDADGDITLRGAFTDGAPIVLSAYGHKSWEGVLPVGTGVIRDSAEGAVAEVSFFMHTPSGRETFDVVSGLAEKGLGQWSFGYDVLDSEMMPLPDGRRARVLKSLAVHEVSPVLRGAGVRTQTLTAKDAADLETIRRQVAGPRLGESEALALQRIRDRHTGHLDDDVAREYVRFLRMSAA